MFASRTESLVDIGAPLGNSYRCWAQKQFPLFNGRDNATLLLGNFQLQPFLDGQKVFGEGASFMCVRYDGCSVSVRPAASFSQNNRHRHAINIYYSFHLVFYLETVCAQDKLSRHHGRRHRDTTVTIAVGSTLGRRRRL